MNNQIKIRAVLSAILLFCICYFNSEVNAYDQIEIKNLKITIGRIKGDFCNKSKSYFNEVIVTAKATKSFGEILWTETFTIDGIGYEQCIGFSKFTPSSDSYYNVKFAYYPDQTTKLFNAVSYNKEISFADIEYKDNIMEGKICNKSSHKLENQVVKLLGINNRNNVLWKKFILLNSIKPHRCQHFSKNLRYDDLHTTSKLLFSTNKLNYNNNIEAGEINNEISYKNIVYRSRRLTGDVCNNSTNAHENVFIRFFAVRHDYIVWHEVITIDHIEPNQCAPFTEYTDIDRRPTKWKFKVTGW